MNLLPQPSFGLIDCVYLLIINIQLSVELMTQADAWHLSNRLWEFRNRVAMSLDRWVDYIAIEWDSGH